VWTVREHKPEDIISKRCTFVRENSSKVDAIRILLNRPQGWGTEALAELKTKLLTAPQRFTVECTGGGKSVRYAKALGTLSRW